MHYSFGAKVGKAKLKTHRKALAAKHIMTIKTIFKEELWLLFSAGLQELSIGKCHDCQYLMARRVVKALSR